MRNLIVRAVTGVFFVGVIVACFLNAITMELLFTLITGLTMWEYTGLVNNLKGVRVNRFISTVAGVYFFIAVGALRSGIVPTMAVFAPYLLTLLYLFISELYAKAENPINDWAYTMLGQMYIALPFSMINVLAFDLDTTCNVAFSCTVPLCIFILLWVNDTGAYCFGSLFGRHKLFPRISPGKSWEGSIGGALTVLVASGLIGHYISEGDAPTVIMWMGLGLIVVVFGTWGDLVESLFKRTLGIKDSGNMLPGHGGMLDRFDSSLMAMPAAVLYLYTLTLF